MKQLPELLPEPSYAERKGMPIRICLGCLKQYHTLFTSNHGPRCRECVKRNLIEDKE